MFDRLLWWGEALMKTAGQRRTPRAAKGATVYGLDATVRAHVRRVSEEPHPVRWPGVAVAVQKVASSMKIAARKTNARGFCGSAGKRAKSTCE
jgi:hypothetical protein